MADLYTRIGQVVTQAVADHLSTARHLEVPHIGRCRIADVQAPEIHGGNWLFTFEVLFPKSSSSFTLGVTTFGSCLLDDVEKIALPEPNFEDDLQKEFPPEHQQAWSALHDALKEELKGLGLRGGSGKGADYFLVEDYYPSRGISGSLHKPKVVTAELEDRIVLDANKKRLAKEFPREFVWRG